MGNRAIGRILRSVSGFYDVQTEDKRITCRGRGSLRRGPETPLTGDMVEISIEQGKGMIEKILPRRNRFIRPAVANMLRLLSLCDDVLEMVRQGKLSAGHARAVLSLKSDRMQIQAAQKIVNLSLSVRQAEQLCKNMLKEPSPRQETFFAVDYVAECEKTLSKKLGRGVKIVSGKKKGRFELEFYGQEDLQVLLDALMNMK